MPENRKYTLIKITDELVKIEYQQSSYDDKDTVKKVSPDKPLPAFVDALQAFAPEVCRMLKLGKNYAENLTVRSVSITHEESGDDVLRGVVVTLAKALDDFNAPFMINTPYLREPGEDDDGRAAMSSDFIALLDKLEIQAGDFIALKRAQKDMFEEEEAETEPKELALVGA